MNYYLRILTLALYWVTFPVIYLLHLIVSLLLALFSPLIHLSHYIALACWYPLSSLPNFETLYIFVGVAVVVGAITGLTIHGVSKIFASILGLDHPLEQPRGRTLESYSVDKEQKWPKRDPPGHIILDSTEVQKDLSPTKEEMLDWIKREQGRGRNKGMIPNTILEEEDSSEVGL